jgi:hypothetical protein
MKGTLANRITEAGRTLWALNAFGLFMDSLVCFLAFGVIFTVIGVSIFWALVPAAVYFLAALFRSLMKSNVIGTIQQKNPKLDERLSAAYDNRDRENVIVSSLLSDVSTEIDNTEASVFFDNRKVTSRVVLSIFLIFLILFATVIDFPKMTGSLFNLNDLINGLNDALQNYGLEFQKAQGGGERWEASNLTTANESEKLGAEPGGLKPGFQSGPIPGQAGGVGSSDQQDIYGQASSASVEGENVNFNLRPDYGGELEIKDESGGSGKPSDVQTPEGAQSAATCDECAIGPQYQDLVKRYFERIVGETE